MTYDYTELLKITGGFLGSLVQNCGTIGPNQFPRLLPASGVSQAQPTGISLREGDVLSYSGVGIFGATVSDVNIKLDTYFDGTQGGTQQYANGEKKGLMGSDGKVAFHLGHSAPTVTIQNEGELYLGLNGNPDTVRGCTKLGSYLSIQIHHCERQDGTVLPAVSCLP
jgi:hypothetical protein